MRIGSLLSRCAKNICVASVLLGPALALAACAAPSQYMGIDLTSPTVSSEVHSLAQRAQAGDKYAQLELGIRFEEGEGVPQNHESARQLYEQAASNTQLKQMIFVPEYGGVRANIVYTGVRPGLEGAQARIDGLSQGSDEQAPDTPEASEKPDTSTLFDRINRGKKRPGIQMVLEIVKVEYFSDLCFYEATQSATMLEELGFDLEPEPERHTSEVLNTIAERCLARQKLPESCKNYQPELRKTLGYLIDVLERRIIAGSLNFFESCFAATPTIAAREVENPTPLDFVLRNTPYSNPEFEDRVQNIPGNAPYALHPRTGAHEYWFDRCRRRLSSYDLSALDLLICGDRDATEEQVERFRKLTR